MGNLIVKAKYYMGKTAFHVIISLFDVIKEAKPFIRDKFRELPVKDLTCNNQNQIIKFYHEKAHIFLPAVNDVPCLL